MSKIELKENLKKYSNLDECPIRNIISRFSGKWPVIILCILSENECTRFNQIQKAIPDISPKVLSDTLKNLETDGIIKRIVYGEVPPRVEYSLTKLGLSLMPYINKKLMKSKSLFSFIVTLFLIYGCSSNRQADGKSNILAKNDINIRGDFQNYFDSCGVEGTIAIYDIRNDKWIVSDTVGLEIETLPASTFKIINLLIALETNTIKDENEIIKWVGSTDTVKYGYRPEIYHDMPVKEAFELSAGWVFVELAKKIGKDTYRKHLAESKYGNNNLSQTEADFWNFGDFAISPKNQVEFVKSFYEEKLPFSKRNIDIVKNVMITEQNEEYTIRAKTGWTRENNINTGWWTGYIETKNGTYIFATRLLQDRKMKRSDFGSCRKEITKKVFKDLNII